MNWAGRCTSGWVFLLLVFFLSLLDQSLLVGIFLRILVLLGPFVEGPLVLEAVQYTHGKGRVTEDLSLNISASPELGWQL